MFRSRLIIGIAAISLAILVSAVAFKLLTQATTLRVAVNTNGTENVRLVTAMSQILARDKTSIRLKVVPSESSATTAAALDNGTADLAISRTDIAIPEHGETIAILHHDPVVMLAAPHSGVTKITELRGKTIGLLPNLGANQRLLNQLLNYYGIPEGAVQIETVLPDNLGHAIKERRIDVVFLVQPIGSKSLRDAYDAIVSEDGSPPTLLAVPEAKAISQRNTAVEDTEIVQGAFGGNPPVPQEAVKTISVSYRLFAHRDVSESTISELTRLLFLYKASVAGDMPLASRLEAVSTDNPILPIHAGAAAYYDGEVKSFMDRWSDWIYIGAMVFGFGGSAIAALFGRDSMRSRAQANALLGELLMLLNKARTADSRTALDDLEHQADVIFAATVTRAADNRIDNGVITTFAFAFDQVRKAIDDRRHVI